MAAAASATLSPATITATATVTSGQQRRTRSRVNYITGLNSFNGLKAQNNKVVSLGVPVSTEHSFGKIVSSLRIPSKSGNGGGAMAAKCSAVAEIFRIAAIMNGLTLIGVAVGFVLLRVEAYVEENE